MANPEHLEILNKGVKAWNKWREENPDLRPDLSRSDLSKRNLSKANLSEVGLSGSILIEANLIRANLNEVDLRAANLTRADLSKASLSNSELHRADLSRANLSEVDLFRADISDTNLIHANLSSAVLSEANLTFCKLNWANLSRTYVSLSNFTRADLRNTNFKHANLYLTTFASCNLSGAKNLETCIHRGSSVIDHITLAQSGKLPMEFLRGCGLPDFIIDNISVLQGSAIQYYSCFISYSTKDEDFATRLHASLQDSGVRCWYAPEDMRGGKKLYDQINEAISIHDKLLLVLSEHSMNSNWVSTEIKKARTREKYEGRQMLFPISITPFEDIKKWELFNSDEGRDLASEIRSYYIPDFSNWKNHDGYNKEFQKLIKSLKGEKVKK